MFSISVFFNLLSLIIVILFQLSRQPWSQPTSSEWPQITHFHIHTHTHTYTHAAATDLASSLATTFNFSVSSIRLLSSPPVPAQHSHWSRAVAPAPPGSHTPSLPAALRTHTATQVRQLTAEDRECLEAKWLQGDDASVLGVLDETSFCF